MVARTDGPSVTDVEHFLFDELAAVLRAEDDLDPTSTFLDVGGDSFTAMLLAKAVEQRYGVAIPTEEFAVDVPLHEVFARLGAGVVGADTPDVTVPLAAGTRRSA
jgi:acyl carrier protein